MVRKLCKIRTLTFDPLRLKSIRGTPYGLATRLKNQFSIVCQKIIKLSVGNHFSTLQTDWLKSVHL